MKRAFDSIAWFGGSQIILPGRNFARFFLVMFLFFSLVMRTAYQAKMYVMMQTDMRHPDLQTIEEMIQQNFTYAKFESDNETITDEFEFMERFGDCRRF